MDADYTLFSGTANPALTAAVAHGLGVAPGRCHVERFPDGELSVTLDETVHVVSVAPLLAAAIQRQLADGSFRDLY